jgi:hypothetical protein
MDQFLKRCFYHSGQYDSPENFAALDKKLKEHEVIGQNSILNDLINNSIWFQCLREFLFIIESKLPGSEQIFIQIRWSLQMIIPST